MNPVNDGICRRRLSIAAEAQARIMRYWRGSNKNINIRISKPCLLFFAYACTHVTIWFTGDMVDISISPSKDA